MSAIVYQHSFDAKRRLAELGVAPEAIINAINAGRAARLSCTENDPPFIHGTEAWRFVVRTLREELLPRGWRKSDQGNYSLICNDVRKFNIVVATGDSLVRTIPGSPKTKSLKGLYTEGAIVRNNFQQDDLFPELLGQELREIACLLIHPVWILLIHITEDECRAELSMPNAFEDGTVVDWAERIFIPNDLVGDSAAQTSDDFDSEIDVPVKRKA